jgi:hypothetical protein
MNTKETTVPAVREDVKRIATIAIKTEKRVIRKVFSREQISSFKDVFFEKHTELADLVEQLDGIKEQFKEDMKPLKKEIGKLSKDIRLGFRDEDTMCYMVDDQDKGIMLYYDEEGFLVDQRKLRPDEKQQHFRSQL